MKKKKELKEFEKTFNKQRRWQIFFAVVFGIVIIIASKTYECDFFLKAKYIYIITGLISIIGYMYVPRLILNRKE